MNFLMKKMKISDEKNEKKEFKCCDDINDLRNNNIVELDDDMKLNSHFSIYVLQIYDGIFTAQRLKKRIKIHMKKMDLIEWTENNQGILSKTYNNITIFPQSNMLNEDNNKTSIISSVFPETSNNSVGGFDNLKDSPIFFNSSLNSLAFLQEASSTYSSSLRLSHKTKDSDDLFSSDFVIFEQFLDVDPIHSFTVHYYITDLFGITYFILFVYFMI
jgi:hypothetical protein